MINSAQLTCTFRSQSSILLCTELMFSNCGALNIPFSLQQIGTKSAAPENNEGKMYRQWLINLPSYRFVNSEFIIQLKWFIFLFGYNHTLTSEVIKWRCLLITVVLWPMCCHTRMSCCRQRAWHPTPYYDIIIFVTANFRPSGHHQAEKFETYIPIISWDELELL